MHGSFAFTLWTACVALRQHALGAVYFCLVLNLFAELEVGYLRMSSLVLAVCCTVEFTMREWCARRSSKSSRPCDDARKDETF